MKFYLHKFKKDPYYFLLYFLGQSILIFGITYFFAVSGPLFNFTLEPIHLLITLPLAFYLGIKVPTMMHNCFHHNLGKFSLFVGELTSMFVLISFGIMCVNHAFHHVHSDTSMDPHNPQNKPFWLFLLTASFTGIEIIERDYLEKNTFKLKNKLIFKMNIALHWIGIPLRLCFWYFLLGQDLFIYLFVPAYAFYFYTFAHVNYYTHKANDKGVVEVVNLNKNLWYKLINYIGDGVYFHKNHHQNPSLYNPMTGRKLV